MGSSILAKGRSSSRRRRVAPTSRRRLLLLAPPLAVVAVSVAAANGFAKDASGSAGGRAAEAKKAKAFYADVKLSLSPLLADVRPLKTALQTVATDANAPSASLRDAAGKWVDDMATARDLVGRLIPAASPEGRQVRDLYGLGTMLYTESARTVARTPRISEADRRVEATRSGLREYLLADRLFDQAKRLLNLHRDLQLETVTLPAEVPDFEREGLQPGKPGSSSPDRSG